MENLKIYTVWFKNKKIDIRWRSTHKKGLKSEVKPLDAILLLRFTKAT